MITFENELHLFNFCELFYYVFKLRLQTTINSGRYRILVHVIYSTYESNKMHLWENDAVFSWENQSTIFTRILN